MSGLIDITSARQTELDLLGRGNSPVVAWDNAANVFDIDVSVGATASGFPIQNALNWATSSICKITPDGSGNVSITSDLAADAEINCAGFIALNLKAARDSVSADSETAFQFYTNLDGAGYTVRSSFLHSQTPEFAVYLGRFEAVTADSVRWEFRDLDAELQIVHLFAGKEMTLSQRIYQGSAPPLTQNQAPFSPNVSEGGILLGSRVNYVGAVADWNIDLMEPGNEGGPRTARFQQFQRAYNKGQPFYWGWRPQTQINDCGYVWNRGGPMQPTNSGPKDYMSTSMSLNYFTTERY